MKKGDQIIISELIKYIDNNGQLLEAIKELFNTEFSKVFRHFIINGYKTSITWSQLGITYDSNKYYVAFADVSEKFENLYFLQTEITSTGVDIYCRHFDEDKNIMDGTEQIKWGEKNWGAFNWGENIDMTINLIIREVAK
jgi:hypothetical protein